MNSIDVEEYLKREADSIPNSEKKYYKPDEYYQIKSYGNTMFEECVIPFEERKKMSVPSKNGLYVPEILLLHFCSKYPNPKNGYPGYWWYKYGIRNVGKVLESLKQRGFIVINKDTEKYVLTDKGKLELQDNAYVPYMHSHAKYTSFTIWDMNKIINDDNRYDYKEIIDKKLQEISNTIKENNNKYMQFLKAEDPEWFDKLNKQDEQIELIQRTEQLYKENKDLKSLIRFWENIWNTTGLLFESSTWLFRLPDLYIKTKEYEKAKSIVEKIKEKNNPCYITKANKYIMKIEKKINKT